MITPFKFLKGWYDRKNVFCVSSVINFTFVVITNINQLISNVFTYDEIKDIIINLNKLKTISLLTI